MLRFALLLSFLIPLTSSIVHATPLNDPADPVHSDKVDLVEATTNPEADLSDYALPDERLSLSLIDSSPDDSYLAVKCDSQNQLFVGGRRKLFVLKPNGDGTWKPRELVYEFPEHTWVYDIEFRGDDVFVSTVSAIYRLPGARTSTKDIEAVRLLYGIPRGHTHQCFHALAWGPNGKLFFTFGDPSWYYGDFTRPDHWAHWTFIYGPDEKQQKYNGVGAAMCINPDGTELEGYTRGLRNSCGLCFDSAWNLFTNDNDHEQFPAIYSPGRLLHIVQHAYFAWPNGWLRSKAPGRMDLMETINEDLGRYVPVLQAYYNDDGLPEEYRNSLMVTRWGKRTVSWHPLKQFGATFHGEEKDLLVCQNLARPVGICVGNSGNVFVAVSHMAQNEGSPTYRSDLLMIKPKGSTSATTAVDLTKESTESLLNSFGSTSHKNSMESFVELTTRDLSKQELPTITASNASQVLPLVAKQDGPNMVKIFQKCLNDQDTAIQIAALKAIEHFRSPKFTASMVMPSVESSDPTVQHSAMLALLSLETGLAGDALQQILLTTAETEDTFVRHAAAVMVSRHATEEQITAWIKSENESVRLVTTIGVGYRTCLVPETASLPAEMQVQPHRNEDAFTVELVDKKVDLRTIGTNGNYTIADRWPFIKDSAESKFGFDMLMSKLDDSAQTVKDTAGHFLSLLRDDRSESRLDRIRAAAEKLQLEVARSNDIYEVWLIGPMDDGEAGFKTEREFESRPIDLAEPIKVGGKEYQWKKQTRNEQGYGSYIDFVKVYGAMDNSSVYAYFRLQASSPVPAQLMLGPDDSVKVFLNGDEVFSKQAVRSAQQYEDNVTVKLTAGANDFLVRFHNVEGRSGSYFNYRAIGKTHLTLPEKPEGMSLAQRLASAAENGNVVPEELLKVDWEEKIKTADPVRGKRLFAGEALGCAKCHSASAEDNVTGGPSLGESGKRFTLAYLVESILLPNQQVSPAFKSSLILDVDGNVINGLVIEETKDSVTVMKSDTTRVTIAKDTIEEKKESEISAMPAGLAKTADEVADVVAYLLQSK